MEDKIEKLTELILKKDNKQPVTADGKDESKDKDKDITNTNSLSVITPNANRVLAAREEKIAT